MTASLLPSQEAFLSIGREAFSFLRSFGFEEVAGPTSRAGTEFELCYRADKRFIFLEGDGHGTGATVLLATTDRRGASYHRHVPAAERRLAKQNND